MRCGSYIQWLLVAITTLTLLASSSGKLGDILERHNKRSIGRSRGRHRNNFNFRRLLLQSAGNWSEYAPNPPSPDQVDCEIEVEVRQIIGGRCVRLGGVSSPAVCQSGIHLDFWSLDCHHILANREEVAADTGHTPYHRSPVASESGGGD